MPKSNAATAKRAIRPAKPSARNPGRLPVKSPYPRPLASAEAKALGAMLASETWYETAASHIVKAFYSNRGNAVHAAQDLNVSWRVLRTWCSSYPELQRSLKAAREDTGGRRR